MSADENKLKSKKTIVAIIAFAALVIVVATAVIWQYVAQSIQQEKLGAEISQQMDEKLKENARQAGELRENINKTIVGTYQTKGDLNSQDPALAIAVMQLMPDGNVAAQNVKGESLRGWWTSQNKNGVDFVAIGFSGKEEPDMYQVYNSYLIDLRSVYFGKVEKAPQFDSTLVSASEKGTMTIELNSQGKASAEFIDTNEESENNGLKYMFSGRYAVDGDYISITLNSAETRFVMFDYNLDDSEADSGIASIFYEKQS